MYKSFTEKTDGNPLLIWERLDPMDHDYDDDETDDDYDDDEMENEEEEEEEEEEEDEEEENEGEEDDEEEDDEEGVGDKDVKKLKPKQKGSTGETDQGNDFLEFFFTKL